MSIINEGRANRPTILDEKMCFDTWVERTTLPKAHSWLVRQGIECSRAGVRHAAWRWVIKNPDEALIVWQNAGLFLSGKDDLWKSWIAKKIRTYMRSSTKQFHDALELNGIRDWYYEQDEFVQCPVNMQESTKKK